MGRIKNLFNKSGGWQLVKQYVRYHFLMKAFLQLLVTGFSNKGLEILRNAANLNKYQYLKNKYWKILDNIDWSRYSQEHKHSNYVWVCWFQGMENAPRVVQRCYESLQKNLTDMNIVLLTEDNISEWVRFPDYILEKYKKGCFTKTHFTDLLRLELLEHYGGVWIDSTCLCTGKIPEFILTSKCFFYRILKPGRDGHAVPISSWLWAAETNNKIVIAVKELMYEYWKKNTSLIDYFLVHCFMQMALEKYPEEEKEMIKFPNSVPHILLLDIFEPFNIKKWEVIKSMTPIHKLAYKRSKEDMGKEGTYFDVIINKGNL